MGEVMQNDAVHLVYVLLESGLCILVGLFLYWLRCRHRLWYGGFEICFAFLLIFLAFFPHRPVFLAVTEAPPLFWLDSYVALIAGIYTLVRGLDNIDVGLPQSSSWRKTWDRLWHAGGR